MLYFIPAWYDNDHWREKEPRWYVRREQTEFDDTVKQIQLFHRKRFYPFRILLLSYAPNFRHFLHRQSVFRAPYWSCFDAMQEVRSRKVRMFSVYDLEWPEGIEFIYTMFALVARLHGEKYAQAEFSEDGNLIQVDLYRAGKLHRRNIYDDRGFLSSTILYDADGALYQDYLTEKGVRKLREFFSDGHVEMNPKSDTFLLDDGADGQVRTFQKNSYESMEKLIEEVFSAYLELLDEKDFFCAAMHGLHTGMLGRTLVGRRLILSFYGERYDLTQDLDTELVRASGYVIADFKAHLQRIRRKWGTLIAHSTDITPFDSRVDFGISQQLEVQKIMVPVDGLSEARFDELIGYLGAYLCTNDNARVHLFTRKADYDRKTLLLARARGCLREAGLEECWAAEQQSNTHDFLDDEQQPIKFFVEQCVDELAVSKCIRQQRLMVDLREQRELYLRITAISVGIPQIVSQPTEYVRHGKNGLILQDMSKLSEALAYYLDSVSNWNDAMIHAYELGKRYTSDVLVKKWKEVIDIVGNDSSLTAGQ